MAIKREKKLSSLFLSDRNILGRRLKKRVKSFMSLKTLAHFTWLSKILIGPVISDEDSFLSYLNKKVFLECMWRP